MNAYLSYMSGEEYKKIKKEKLLRRLHVFRVLVYVAAAIAVGSFAFCIIDWHGISWILIGVTYAMLAVNFGMQRRMIKKELLRREALHASKN
jgi:hypothetical protein